MINKLAKSVRVGPFDFPITIESENWRIANSRAGEFSSVEMCIRIAMGYAMPMRLCDTVLHEVGHAIWWVYGLRNDTKEEEVVSLLATAWTQVFRDNPWLLTWIAEATKS